MLLSYYWASVVVREKISQGSEEAHVLMCVRVLGGTWVSVAGSRGSESINTMVVGALEKLCAWIFIREEKRSQEETGFDHLLDLEAATYTHEEEKSSPAQESLHSLTSQHRRRNHKATQPFLLHLSTGITSLTSLLYTQTHKHTTYNPQDAQSCQP